MGNQLQIIKCVTDNTQIVTKSKIEDFNTNSQLIVNESQEALFYKDGQALDLFPSGRHTLTTENLPFFKRFFSKLFGGGKKTPFTCEVFFINKVSVLDITWGTDTPIPLEDPKYGLLVNVRASGQTGIRVIDSRKFVVKLVGQLPQYTVDSIRKSIKGVMLSMIKESIATAIVNQKVSILEISTHLSELSDEICKKVNERIASEYGLEITQFYINTIFAGEGDLKKLREVKEKRLVELNNIELEALRTQTLDIDMEAKRMQAWGYSYQDRRQFDVLESAAQNTGAAGGIINAGVGLGMGFGVMNQVSNSMQNMVNQAQQPQQPAQPSGMICASCNGVIPAEAKFCPSCGKEAVPAKRFCTNCGQELTPETKFCPSCGTKA